MPDEIEYDETAGRLLVGKGFIENVPAAVWNYEVSRKRVLTQWFSYRKKNRERPIIGDRRPPSKLGDIQPEHWLAEYTTELLNVLHVLALHRIAFTPAKWKQSKRNFWRRSVKEKPYPTMDEAIAAIAGKSIEELVAAARQRGGPRLISADELRAAGCFDFPPGLRKSVSVEQERLPLFGDDDTVATKQDSTPRDPDSDELSEERP